MHVLRLCPVFEPPATALLGRGARFAPIGGMHSHTAQLTRALDELGVRQTVVTTRPPTAPAVARLGRHCRVVRLGASGPLSRHCYGPAAWRRAPTLVRGVDLVHAHLGEDPVVMPLALRTAACAGAPLVVTVHHSLQHTLRVSGPRSLLLKTVGGALEQRLLEHADAVITLTERLRDLLPGDAVHVIPSGLGPEFTARSPARTWRMPDGDAVRPRLGYVGRLQAHKSVDVLLRAFALLGGDGGRLLIVGDGPQRPRLRRLAGRLGIAERVTFLGALSHDQIPAVLRTLDAVVLPSRCEEFGSILPEAMHCGVPVVATQVGGIPELIEHGRSGLLVPPGSPARLADALRRLLGDPGLAAAMAGRARRRVRGHTWDRLARRVLKVYQSVLTTPAPQPLPASKVVPIK